MNGRTARPTVNFVSTFRGEDQYGDANLPFGFRAFAVFFESKVRNGKEYADALGALAPIWSPDPLLNFTGALIIRGHTCPDYSGSISYLRGVMPNLLSLLSPSCEYSEMFPSFVEDTQVTVVSGGFGPNEFWSYMLEMIHALNGHDSDLPGMGAANLTGGYGRRIGGSGKVPLFSREAASS